MTATASRPNIVFILADDMGYGDFGRMNDGLTQTPRLDALMDEGMTLRQHYSASPVCNPSRAALMTGRYPHRTGSIDTLEWRGLERLALRERTLADFLRPAGYTNGLVGKWHLGAFDPRYAPRKRGFDESVCFRGGMHDYYQWRIEFNDVAKRADGRYMTDVWTTEACDFIDRHANSQPFFLHLTFNAPHGPWQCPEEDVKPFADTGKFTSCVSKLYGMIRRMDNGIAQVLERLDAHGLRENTIVIFTSDNGPQFSGEGDNSIHRFNCQWRGCKGNVWEGGIRVPCIIRWPGGGVPAGATCDDMMHMADWLPTLMSAVNAQRPADALPLDGVDVLPILRGQQGKTCTQRCWQWNRYTPVMDSNAAVRDGDWKLVYPPIRETMAVPDIHWLKTSMYEPEHFINNGVIQDADPPREVPPAGEPQLFNLAADPLEQNDLHDQHPDQVSRLKRQLENWFESVEADRRTIDDQW